jgi:hypothetical protein
MIVEREFDDIGQIGMLRKQNEDRVKSGKVADGIGNAG